MLSVTLRLFCTVIIRAPVLCYLPGLRIVRESSPPLNLRLGWFHSDPKKPIATETKSNNLPRLSVGGRSQRPALTENFSSELTEPVTSVASFYSDGMAANLIFYSHCIRSDKSPPCVVTLSLLWLQPPSPFPPVHDVKSTSRRYAGIRPRGGGSADPAPTRADRTEITLISAS